VTLGLKRHARGCISYRNSVVPESDRLISSVEDAITQKENTEYLVLVKSPAKNCRIGFALCSAVNSLRWTSGNLRQLGLMSFSPLVVFIEHLLIVQVLGRGAGLIYMLVSANSPPTCVLMDVSRNMTEAASTLAVHAIPQCAHRQFMFEMEICNCDFLEIKTCLQVEHSMTEGMIVLGLVECIRHITID
jgi:acetyl/propionyl-CoA carboxylase alpha subunit